MRQHTADARVYGGDRLSLPQAGDQPALDARAIRPGPEHCPPARDLTRRHTRNVTADTLRERGNDVALSVDEPDDDRLSWRFDFMYGIGPHDYRATLLPPLLRPS